MTWLRLSLNSQQSTLTKLESRAGIALPTRRDGFANRRLRCSANGMIENVE